MAINKKDREQRMRGGLSALLGESEPQQQEPTPDEVAEQIRQDAINKVEDAELREALRQHRLSGRGRPRKNVPHKSRTDGYERITTIASIVKMEKLRAIAMRETLTIKEVLEACMDLAIEAYEKKHGEIQVSTMSRKGKKLFK